MKRAEVEALLFRWQALYPSAGRTDPVEAAVRLEEWMATPEIVDCDMEVAADAFQEWKVSHDWPPTPHQFIDTIKLVRHRRRRAELEQVQQELLAEYDETIVPPEEAKRYIASVRHAIEEVRRRSHEMLSDKPGSFRG